MNALDQKRRSLLLGVGILGIGRVLPQPLMGAEAAAGQGYVLGSTEGEHLIHFRDQGKILIKAGSAKGSDNVGMGTQQVMAGTGIPTHRHLEMEEAFYVLEGGGIFILNDVRHAFEKGATIVIPKNNWHGFENPAQELLLLWIVSPPGLENFFRETCSPPGVPPKQLTRQQIRDIARKYGTEFR
jgi:quercetin dioxygenase-like cupin family protein